MPERLTTIDESLVRGWGQHIQRYEFGSGLCCGKTVLDAGCGVGYGSHCLARHGARMVYGVDLAAEAIEEAKKNFTHPNVRFIIGNLEALEQAIDASHQIETVVNLENLEHLVNPARFLTSVQRLLSGRGGMLIVSTPNGDITEFDEQGHNCNPFHTREYTETEFLGLLSPYFGRVELYGQWQTNDARLRVLNEERVFEQLCETYYNPFSRLGRIIKRLFGKRSCPPPQFTAKGDSFSADYIISPLNDSPFRWPPVVLIAVCSVK